MQRLDSSFVMRQIIQHYKLDAGIERAAIDRTAKADADTRLQVEPIQFVEQRDIAASAGLRVAIGRWKIDPDSGVLERIGYGEGICGEWPGRGRRKIE